jgi:thiamine pyrophosphate-dependent acetolactate synthase large subunit-like protein
MSDAFITDPKRQVISLFGDGGFAMLMGDFLTLVQQDLPIKVVIFNNSTLDFVALEMKASGFLEAGTKLRNPNSAAVATAAGIHGVRVEDPGDLEVAVKDIRLTTAKDEDNMDRVYPTRIRINTCVKRANVSPPGW